MFEAGGRARRQPPGRVSGASAPKGRSRWRFQFIPAQLGNAGLETHFRKQRGDFRPQSAGARVLVVGGAAQNIADLFFHAAAVPSGAALQTELDRSLQMTNSQLRHDSPPKTPFADITIS